MRILTVCFDKIFATINERFNLMQVSIYKNLEFYLGDKNSSFFLYFILRLLLSKQGCFVKKNGSK